MEFEPTIGFEVHAQLRTRTKIFCGCLNDVGGRPNSRTCPVCLGLPGALPVLNEEAVELGLRVAVALRSEVAGSSGFARKNYFYPDLPKGYQITQYAAPLASGGYLDFDVGGATRRVRVVQVHLEEDAGKSVHSGGGNDVSLVDMNRCGVPLVEIVTRPDITSIEEADAFLNELRLVLLYLGVSSANMHEGSLRFDTNVSVSPAGSALMGTRTEVKNLNSFRAVRRALRFEIERQSELLSGGLPVHHETLLWDENAERAVPMRSKEAASDYRYFPEPDLVGFSVSEERLGRARQRVPDLPEEVRRRFRDVHGLTPYVASVLASDPDVALFYELALRSTMRAMGRGGGEPGGPDTEGASAGSSVPLSPTSPATGDAPEGVAGTVANWVSVVLAGYLNERGLSLYALAESAPATSASGNARERLTALAARLGDVVASRVVGAVSEPAARRLFIAAMESGDSVESLVDSLGLRAMADAAELKEVVAEVLGKHPEEVRRYRSGTSKLLRYFVGQVLKETGGSADPEEAARLLREKLDSGGDVA